MIADAVDEDRAELPPEAGTHWIAGLDPAFSSDPFALAIVGRSRFHRDGRLVLGLARRWKPARRKPGSFEEEREIADAVLDEVAGICRRYAARAVTDQYRAAGIVDYLRRKRVGVTTEAMTSATKTDAFTALRARINLGAVELYNETQLVAELRRLRTKYAAGRSSVVNPRSGGSHGDLAQALALAVWEHDRHGMQLSGTSQPLPAAEDPLSPELRSMLNVQIVNRDSGRECRCEHSSLSLPVCASGARTGKSVALRVAAALIGFEPSGF